MIQPMILAPFQFIHVPLDNLNQGGVAPITYIEFNRKLMYKIIMSGGVAPYIK
jgi:hypothetical protein